MAGLKCNGGTIKSADSRLSRAYCDGMAARVASSSPVNPFSTTNEAENAAAWDAGVAQAAIYAGGNIDKGGAGCCALVGVSVPV